MKLVVNETQSTVVLAKGRLRLNPKGTATDRKSVPNDIAGMPDVLRFQKQGKISILGAEAASTRARQENKAAAAKKPAAAPKPEPKPAPKPAPKVEAPKPKAEASKLKAVEPEPKAPQGQTKSEPAKSEPKAEAKDESKKGEAKPSKNDASKDKSGGWGKKRSGRR